MPCRSTLLFVLLGALPGCAAQASLAEVNAAEARARSAQAEATREHARLVELEARLVEMERRLANRPRACEPAPDPQTLDVASARGRAATDPRRSEGDFLAEAHAAAKAPETGAPATERERIEQLLDGLREYGPDVPTGMSLERREALRVLLRRERQLDLMNPWGGH